MIIATGARNVPAGGFARLGGAHGLQPFCITRVVDGSQLLPTSSTCFNILRLPQYTSKAQLQQRLLTAIRAGSQGFEFAWAWLNSPMCNTIILICMIVISVQFSVQCAMYMLLLGKIFKNLLNNYNVDTNATRTTPNAVLIAAAEL